ncbi:MAG: hypothetical protein QG656_582, partial [Candidatus Hydrogenedentes bacterium]|nr:hypothetical protein [Candidatus Hydrogenedentota bacterium]
MNEGTETRKTVLLLGAYGLAGSAIAHGLLAETDARLLLTGRDAAKLSALANQLGSSRVETRILDAFDAPALRGVCDHADLAINAVGPYAAGGADIARTVVESGTSYIDFANEQVHYRRLESLDARARERGVMLLTAAGAVPGVSTLVALHAARQLPETDELA